MGIRLQAIIGGASTGLGGMVSGSESVFAEFDPASGVLLIDATQTVPAGQSGQRRADCALVTNNANADDYDELFDDEHLRQAIKDYYSFAARGLLYLTEAVTRHNPTTKIEPDGLDERGPKYRFAQGGMSNGQLAVIILCWYALRQQQFAGQLAAFDDFDEHDILTVGLPDDVSRSVQPRGWW